MNTKKIIPLLLIFIAAVSTISMACATDPGNGTDQAITPEEQTSPTIHYDKDCNGSLDVNNNTHVVSHDDVLPGPVQENKTIQYENNTQKHMFVAYDQAITQEQPFYNIVDEITLQQALNTGGHYKITQDFKLKENYYHKESKTPVYIDGGHHVLTGDHIITGDNKPSTVTITLDGTSEWHGVLFNRVQLRCYADTTFDDCLWTDQDGRGSTHCKAIEAQDCTLTLTNTTFFNCAGSATDHGAVYVKNGRLKATDCLFAKCGNNAKFGTNNEGGAIFVTNSESTISGCTFRDCYTLGDGGAVCTENGNTLIKACNFINCYNLEKTWIFSTSNKGAAIYCMGTTNVEGCIFKNCKSEGLRYEKWNGVIDRDNDITVSVKDCIFDLTNS